MSQEDAKAADVEAIRSHVKRCTIVATSLMVVISAVVYQVIPVSRLAALDTVMSRLVFTLQWNALTVAVIFVMIAVIGQVRFYTNQPNPLAPVQSVDREQLEVVDSIDCLVELLRIAMRSCRADYSYSERSLPRKF